jgi:lysophospholipase L1-like esterase
MKFKNTLILLLLSLATAGRVAAQDNLDFEQGLTGWMTSGKASIDKTNYHKGSQCIKIGEGTGSISKRMSVTPLAVVQFEAYLKSNKKGVRGYSFIRFYDTGHHRLLEFNSSKTDSLTYQQTGNYTEAPPNASYMEIGIEKVSAQGYIYADDFTIDDNVGKPKTDHQPQVNIDQYMRPFWHSDTIYNETVLLFSLNGNAADGKLLYQPDHILSVKSFDLKTEFTEGKDYALKGNVIERLPNSPIPFRADASFDRAKDLAWFNTQSQWIVITYTHHDQWNGPVPQYKGERIPHVMAKLKAKAPLKIAALGMSITRGLNISSYDDVPPYMPTYVSLFTNRLKKAYHYNDIKLYNAALPGAIVDWGAQYADKYINPIRPDLVVLDFGMNDFWRYTPEQFKDFIQTIIDRVKAGNPNVEFLLISNMKFDPDYILDSDKNKTFYVSNMEGYSHVLKDMEAEGIINLDMTSLSGAIYQRKKAKDCISNPLHPNDYLARWYAQGLSQLLIREL